MTLHVDYTGGGPHAEGAVAMAGAMARRLNEETGECAPA